MGTGRGEAVRGEQEADTSIHPPSTVFSRGFVTQESLSTQSLYSGFHSALQLVHLALLERCSSYHHPNALKLQHPSVCVDNLGR